MFRPPSASSAPADEHHRRVGGRRRTEGTRRHVPAVLEVEEPFGRWPADTAARTPSCCRPGWEHDAAALEGTRRRGETPQQGGADRERRVRHDLERPSGPTQLRGISAYDHDVVERKPRAKGRHPRLVQLDGDHGRAMMQELCGDAAVAGADVDDEVARSDVRCGDQALYPPTIESVPPPAACVRGHGAPSPSSCREPRQGTNDGQVSNATRAARRVTRW